MASSTPGGTLSIVVRTIEHGNIYWSMPPTGTIGDLKDAVQIQTSVPRSRQRILHRGRELQNNSATLASLDIHNNTVLHMVSRPAPEPPRAPAGQQPRGAAQQQQQQRQAAGGGGVRLGGGAGMPATIDFSGLMGDHMQGTGIVPDAAMLESLTQQLTAQFGGVANINNVSIGGIAAIPVPGGGAGSTTTGQRSVNLVFGGPGGTPMAINPPMGGMNTTMPGGMAGGIPGLSLPVMSSLSGNIVPGIIPSFPTNRAPGGPPLTDPTTGRITTTSLALDGLDRMLLRLEAENMEENSIPLRDEVNINAMRSPDQRSAWAQAVITFLCESRTILEGAGLNREVLAAVNRVLQGAGLAPLRLGVRSFPVSGLENSDDEEYNTAGSDNGGNSDEEEFPGLRSASEHSEGPPALYEDSSDFDDDDEFSDGGPPPLVPASPPQGRFQQYEARVASTAITNGARGRSESPPPLLYSTSGSESEALIEDGDEDDEEDEEEYEAGWHTDSDGHAWEDDDDEDDESYYEEDSEYEYTDDEEDEEEEVFDFFRNIFGGATAAALRNFGTTNEEYSDEEENEDVMPGLATDVSNSSDDDDDALNRPTARRRISADAAGAGTAGGARAGSRASNAGDNAIDIEAAPRWFNSVHVDDLLLVVAVTLGEVTRRFMSMLGATSAPTGVNAFVLHTAEHLTSLSTLQGVNRRDLARQLRLVSGHLTRLASTAAELGRCLRYLPAALQSGNLAILGLQTGFITVEDQNSSASAGGARAGGSRQRQAIPNIFFGTVEHSQVMYSTVDITPAVHAAQQRQQQQRQQQRDAPQAGAGAEGSAAATEATAPTTTTTTRASVGTAGAAAGRTSTTTSASAHLRSQQQQQQQPRQTAAASNNAASGIQSELGSLAAEIASAVTNVFNQGTTSTSTGQGASTSIAPSTVAITRAVQSVFQRRAREVLRDAEESEELAPVLNAMRSFGFDPSSILGRIEQAEEESIDVMSSRSGGEGAGPAPTPAPTPAAAAPSRPTAAAASTTPDAAPTQQQQPKRPAGLGLGSGGGLRPRPQPTSGSSASTATAAPATSTSSANETGATAGAAPKAAASATTTPPSSAAPRLPPRPQRASTATRQQQAAAPVATRPPANAAAAALSALTGGGGGSAGAGGGLSSLLNAAGPLLGQLMSGGDQGGASSSSSGIGSIAQRGDAQQHQQQDTSIDAVLAAAQLSAEDVQRWKTTLERDAARQQQTESSGQLSDAYVAMMPLQRGGGGGFLGGILGGDD